MMIVSVWAKVMLISLNRVGLPMVSGSTSLRNMVMFAGGNENWRWVERIGRRKRKPFKQGIVDGKCEDGLSIL